MTQRIFRQYMNPPSIVDCLAVLAGAVLAFPVVLMLTLPLIADF